MQRQVLLLVLLMPVNGDSLLHYCPCYVGKSTGAFASPTIKVGPPLVQNCSLKSIKNASIATRKKHKNSQATTNKYKREIQMFSYSSHLFSSLPSPGAQWCLKHKFRGSNYLLTWPPSNGLMDEKHNAAILNTKKEDHLPEPCGRSQTAEPAFNSSVGLRGSQSCITIWEFTDSSVSPSYPLSTSLEPYDPADYEFIFILFHIVTRQLAET